MLEGAALVPRSAAILCAALARVHDAEPSDGVFLDLHGAALGVSASDLGGNEPATFPERRVGQAQFLSSITFSI